MVAVITGDIVNSRGMPDKLDLLEVLRVTFGLLREYGYIEEGDTDIYRGDSFQLVVRKPFMALRAAIILRAKFIASTPIGHKGHLDARLAIGFGDITFRADNVRQSTGTAFIHSGHGLDKMKSRERMRLVSGDKEIDEEFAVGLMLSEFIISRWSIESAETAIAHFLYKESQTRMAKSRFKISQPAVSKRFKAAGLDAINKLIQRYEKVVKIMVERRE